MPTAYRISNTGILEAFDGRYLDETIFGGTPGIVSTNLKLNLDASSSSSYSGTGTTWTDAINNNKVITNSLSTSKAYTFNPPTIKS
jgi:hypothetical protein